MAAHARTCRKRAARVAGAHTHARNASTHTHAPLAALSGSIWLRRRQWDWYECATNYGNSLVRRIDLTAYIRCLRGPLWRKTEPRVTSCQPAGEVYRLANQFLFLPRSITLIAAVYVSCSHSGRRLWRARLNKDLALASLPRPHLLPIASAYCAFVLYSRAQVLRHNGRPGDVALRLSRARGCRHVTGVRVRHDASTSRHGEPARKITKSFESTAFGTAVQTVGHDFCRKRRNIRT